VLGTYTTNASSLCKSRTIITVMSTLHPTTHPILNPDVYLNYLPPKVAEQFEVARDLYLATLGVRFTSTYIFPRVQTNADCRRLTGLCMGLPG